MEETGNKEFFKLNLHQASSIFVINVPKKPYTKLFTCYSTLPRNYECQYCLLKTDLKVTVYNHISASHEGKEMNYNLGSPLKCHKCENCDFQTHSVLTLTGHSYKCKRKVSVEKNSKFGAQHNRKWLKCDKCSYRSEYKYTLKHHKLIHEEESRWFECGKCSYKAKSKPGLDQHRLSIHAAPAKWFECEHCIFKCRRKGDWKNHSLRKHAEEVTVEEFQCGQCSYCARSKVLLLEHEAMHATSKKWFECEQYTYTLNQKSNGNLQ